MESCPACGLDWDGKRCHQCDYVPPEVKRSESRDRAVEILSKLLTEERASELVDALLDAGSR